MVLLILWEMIQISSSQIVLFHGAGKRGDGHHIVPEQVIEFPSEGWRVDDSLNSSASSSWTLVMKHFGDKAPEISSKPSLSAE